MALIWTNLVFMKIIFGFETAIYKIIKPQGTLLLELLIDGVFPVVIEL